LRELHYISRRQAEWDAWDRWLRSAKPGADADMPLSTLPARFRRLCHDLALARDRQYSSALVDTLQQRVLAAHQRIYGAHKPEGNALVAFIGAGFPALVRREWRVVLAAFLMLMLPMAFMVLLLQITPEAVYLFLSPDQAAQMEEMYSTTAKHLGRPRSASSEWAMWGLYVANNVRIDFQCFAGGIAFGVGAVFYLLYNGFQIGAVAGHLTQLGLVETFWGFVAGHSAFELTGAVLSGAAGLKIGIAMLFPGRRSRLVAIKESSRTAVRLLYGAATLTFFAAFIEAFWSPNKMTPFEAKVGIGIVLWCLTWAYLLLAGRRWGRNGT
jgi:uncharacterized membrane protein SpoIIM required for sporulation